MATPAHVPRIVANVVEHLDTSHPRFRGSEKVRKALNSPDLDLYLRSWVLPQLQAIADGNVPDWMRKK